MAALSPGAITVTPGPRLEVEFFYKEAGQNLGTVSLRAIDGYSYTPPDEGQVWPRGDYAPMG